MKINKIETLIVGHGQGASFIQVGRDFVTEILDKSIEFENSIIIIFNVMAGETLLKQIINQPVEIHYFTE
jgi:hypothetical protein